MVRPFLKLWEKNLLYIDVVSIQYLELAFESQFSSRVAKIVSAGNRLPLVFSTCDTLVSVTGWYICV